MGGPSDFPTAREKSGVGTMTGNYADFARSFGAHGIEVNKLSELAPASETAKGLNISGKTVLIDVKLHLFLKEATKLRKKQHEILFQP